MTSLEWSSVLPPGAVGAVSPSRPAGLASAAADLEGCTRCKLSGLGRHTIVVGEGSPQAELVFVGEAPGEQEDLQGRPFIGRAGQLLDKMIEAMGYQRSAAYICNLVKCRPPENRNPEPDEIAACSPFLERQLAALPVRVVVTLGKFASQMVLRSETPISALRGQVHRHTLGGREVAVIPTFHPAYLLRNPAAKKETWADLKLAMAELAQVSS